MSETDDAKLTITWSHTDTYRRSLPVSAVADVTGLAVEELLADPSLLSGAANPATAELLKAAHNAASWLPPTEVEIIDSQTNDQTNLLDLLDRARRAIRAEVEAGSTAGRAFAALMAGLRREGLID
ncbi:hypothetical protein [Paractinoplanes rishiriensis]|uniref:Uncharacterized protein n=1 Tax=Paractinoplanes rishiriensis TaxID=1050105 RepID=A0A919N2U8_9ACTN|nr:hypothetical protein [Actinoplanes rishiriensis]GIF02008.1 hypothetical protein Ari01nite_94720 [Actinoplanes rishiriensis]